MQVEKHANARIELWLSPEDDIEKAFVEAMVKKAAKGVTVRLEMAGEKMIVAVEG
jgi:hypothetical protein